MRGAEACGGGGPTAIATWRSLGALSAAHTGEAKSIAVDKLLQPSVLMVPLLGFVGKAGAEPSASGDGKVKGHIRNPNISGPARAQPASLAPRSVGRAGNKPGFSTSGERPAAEADQDFHIVAKSCTALCTCS